MLNWIMNTAQLETGMLIRRPGLDEALEVVNVRNGQAKIKLPGGKTSTISATAEVEFAWPESLPKIEGREESKNYRTEISLPEEPSKTKQEEQPSDWQTDWSLLSVGAEVQVLGESGEFTVLRLTDSSARIKSSASGQLQSMSIGHKFKVIEPGKSNTKPAGKKSRSKKGAPVVVQSEPEPEAVTDEPELPFDEGTAGAELLDDDEIPTPEDENDGDDDEDESDLDNDDNDDPDDLEEEETAMPKSTKGDTVNKSSARSGDQLLTLVEIAERTGISYPTLSRYVREHGNRLPSEGSGRKRRFYESAIDIFREIRGESRSGRKPKDGSKRTAAKAPRKVKVTRGALTGSSEGRKSTAPESKGASVSVAAWVPANGQTIDSILSSAIDHANAQIIGLQSLIENLQAEREQLKLWS